jgi:hypothetical protein
MYGEVNGDMQLGYGNMAYLQYNDGENFGWGIPYASSGIDKKKYTGCKNADDALRQHDSLGQHTCVEITKQLANYLVSSGVIVGDEAKTVFDRYMGAAVTSAKEFLPCDKNWEKKANNRRDEIFRKMCG